MVVTYRQIIESERFQQERDAIMSEVDRWDEVMRGIGWGLAQAPTKVGRPTSAPDTWAIPTDDWPDAPAVVIYYTFDEDNITLLSVIRADPSAT